MTLEQKRKLAARRKAAALRRARQNANARHALNNNDPVLRALHGIEGSTRDFAQRVKAQDLRIKFLERQIRSRSPSLPGVEDGGSFRGEKKKFMFSKAVRYMLTGREAGNEFEVEVMKQAEKKIDKAVHIAGQDSIGGFIVPVEVTGELIQNVRDQLVCEAAGVRYLPNLTGSPVNIGKKTGSTSGYWVGEIEAPTESEIALGEISMTPKTAAGLCKISKRLIMLANEAAETMLREDLSETLALLIDDAVLHGTGSAFQPLGYSNTPGINSYPIGADGGEATLTHLQKMIAALREAKGLTNAKNVAWVFAPEFLAYLEQELDADGRPLYKLGQTSLEDSPTPAKLLGFPYYWTGQIPTDLTKGSGTGLTEVFLADWDAVMVGQWGGLEIAVSDQTSDAFEKRQVWIQAYQDLDVGVRGREAPLLQRRGPDSLVGT